MNLILNLMIFIQIINLKKLNVQKKKNPDLTEYDGYASNHRCYNCGCVKVKKTGEKKCVKEFDYMSKWGSYGFSFGCDPKWNCDNCKDCQKCDGLNMLDCKARSSCIFEEGMCISDTVDKDDKDDKDVKEEDVITATCKNCKCINDKCQRQGNVLGILLPCDNDICTECLNCGENNKDCSNSSFEYVQSEDEINRNNIVINNVSEKDLNTIL